MLLQYLRLEGVHLGIQATYRSMGLAHNSVQPPILNPLFHGISNCQRDFHQFFQSLQNQVRGTPISNLPPSLVLCSLSAFLFWHMAHALCSSCVSCIHVCELLNRFHECSEIRCFNKKSRFLNYLRTFMLTQMALYCQINCPVPVLNLGTLLCGNVLKHRHKKQTVYMGEHEGRGTKGVSFI